MEDFLLTTSCASDKPFFAILCDGHGGPEAALHTVKHMQSEIMKNCTVLYENDISVHKYMVSLFTTTQQELKKAFGNTSLIHAFFKKEL